MHATSVTLLSVAIVGVACFLPTAGDAVLAVWLAPLVAMLGLPHGAADHRFARPLLEPLAGRWWGILFFTWYLLTAACVLISWFVTPAVTIIMFVIASAWHFGIEEPRPAVRTRWQQHLHRLARGGLIIWVPVVFQRDEVYRLFLITSPAESQAEVLAAMSALYACAWLFLGLAAMGCVRQFAMAIASTGRKRRVLMNDSALLLSLAFMFALASPLVSFVVYFCAWHSARGLKRLRRELGETWPQLIKSLAPMTLVAIALISTTTVLLLRMPDLDNTLIRATFLGLSALAVPHLLLHGAWPLLHQLTPTIRPKLLSTGRSA